MCLVEEKASLKPLASCAVTLLNGHIIYTNTESVKRAREGVLEYLSINHPLDCPICDQGGECDLQDQTMVFGADRGRFYENKRSTPNKNLGFLIKTFLNRCIHCARCTRFLEEVAGTNELQLLGRGYKTEISNHVSSFVHSEISGNIIDLCPVGALTSKPYAFKARPWELFSVYTYDIHDGLGANVQLDFRGLELMRILPKTNRFPNEEWISDKTRFSYDSFNIQRLTDVYLFVRGDVNRTLNWVESLIFLKNVFFMGEQNNFQLGRGDFQDLESCLAIKDLVSVSNLLCSYGLDVHKCYDSRNFFGIKDLGNLDMNLDTVEDLHYVIVESNLRFESPVINLKSRKIFSNHESKILVVGFLSNFNFEFEHITKNISEVALNLLVQDSSKKTIFTTTQLLSYNVNLVSSNLTNLTRAELNHCLGINFSYFDYLSFNVGQPENINVSNNTQTQVEMLHHVDDEYIQSASNISTRLLLPTSFYFEKPTSFLNNSFIFFNLLTQFSIKIPNTKPEWKIIVALAEFINGPANFGNLNSLIPRFEFRLVDFFILKEAPFVFFRNLQKSSLINNFYLSNLISRLSPIMNLCSKKYTLVNDYIYSTF
jgi:hypothetical protein